MISLNIKEEIYRAVLTDPDEREAGIHVSHIAKALREDACRRQIYYDLTEPIAPIDAESAFIFFRGKAWHREFAAHLKAMGWRTEEKLSTRDMTGTFDAFKDGVLLDFKTSSFIPRDDASYQKYYSHYINQLLLYAALLEEQSNEIKKIYQIFIDVTPEKLTFKDLYFFPISFTPEQLHILKLKSIVIANELQDAALMGKVPPRNVGHWCNYCQFLVKCFKET